MHRFVFEFVEKKGMPDPDMPDHMGVAPLSRDLPAAIEKILYALSARQAGPFFILDYNSST
jgi:hypothetical protein